MRFPSAADLTAGRAIRIISRMQPPHESRPGTPARPAGRSSGSPPAVPWKKLLAWYRANRREMPWRGSRDPYAVWVSETMLQQTRVETVRGYFARFLARFPDVRALAAAGTDDVLKLWEGLGYYVRARNLHAAARLVAERGGFPATAAEWAALPGVGPYTAAAVASICAGEPVPVVDGNVTRVAMRLRAAPGDGRGPGERAAIAAWLRPAVAASGAPGDFNQAVMELGETLCVPKAPKCLLCPVRAACRAAAEGDPERYPARRPAKALPVRRFVAFVARDAAGRALLAKRPATGLLGGLWELPMAPVGGAETRGGASSARRALASLGLRARTLRPLGDVSHVFSHFRQELCVWEAVGAEETRKRKNRAFVHPAGVAVATATTRALALRPDPGRGPGRGAASLP